MHDEEYFYAERKINAPRDPLSTYFSLIGIGLTEIPEAIGQLTHLQRLDLSLNNLSTLPESIGQLTELRSLNLSSNQLKDLPLSLAQLEHLEWLELDNNPLNPELATAYHQGMESVRDYMRAKAAVRIKPNDDKLQSHWRNGQELLLHALRGDLWKGVGL